MKTAADIRRANLESLIGKHGSIAALNEALGRDRRDATLGIIRTQARDSKTGTPKQMGSRLARSIEERLALPNGWMDADHDVEPLSTAVEVVPVQLGARRVPLINSVQAGAMAEMVAPYPAGFALDWLLTDLELSEGAFALEIQGDSMTPDFRPGDRIIVDPTIKPGPGDFVVAKNGDHEATFKKYRPRRIDEKGEEVFELVPLNDDYPTMYSDVTPIRIIGTMVEHRRYRRR